MEYLKKSELNLEKIFTFFLFFLSILITFAPFFQFGLATGRCAKIQILNLKPPGQTH